MTRFFLCLIFSSTLVLAQEQAIYEAVIPLVDRDRNLGDLKAQIKGDDIISVEKESLINAMRSILKPDTLKALENLPNEVSPSLLPFPLKLNAQDFKIESQLDLSIRSSEDTKLRSDLKKEYPGAIMPAPFGGALNYHLEQSWGHERLGGKSFSGQFSPFVNIKSLVLENQTFYQSQTNPQWFRGDTRFVKDFQDQEIRTQLGDIYPQVQGFMVGRPMGGINLHRNFSLNPYRLPFPTGTQNFTLRARSLVKYYVNNILVKTEYLMAGNYTAKDIPLNNGLNTILIEATDDLGQKQVFIFKSATSINLLNKGESRFDISYGTPFFDNNFERQYRESDGKIFSGFYQYGFSSEFSGSMYLQNQTTFNLLGAEVIQATPIGNINLGHAESLGLKTRGQGNSISYQYVSQGQLWYQAHTLSLRYENRSDQFIATKFDLASSVKDNYSANYTLPLSNLMTVSTGINYGDVRDNELSDRYGYDATLNIRLFGHHNLSVFTGRTRDEYKNWNTVAFVFLTITFPESNNFLSTLYDDVQKSTRITFLRDNQNKLYRARSQTTVENTTDQQSGEADMFYPTPYGDFGARLNANKTRHENDTAIRGSTRLNGAMVFAYQDKEWGYGLSRPIPGSFVIFKPEERLKNQKIALKSTSPYTEAESGLFNEITFSNLLAYQYRDIQLDPSLMEDGRSLVKEKFTLYPTYRSAHVLTLKERGAVILRGTIQNLEGEALALQVGHVGEIPFFTNRRGEFFIEGVEPGEYEFSLDEYKHKLKINIQPDGRGLKDLGIIKLKE